MTLEEFDALAPRDRMRIATAAARRGWIDHRSEEFELLLHPERELRLVEWTDDGVERFHPALSLLGIAVYIGLPLWWIDRRASIVEAAGAVLGVVVLLSLQRWTIARERRRTLARVLDGAGGGTS